MPRNKEQYNLHQREWRAKNKEKISEKNREDYNKKRLLSYFKNEGAFAYISSK